MLSSISRKKDSIHGGQLIAISSQKIFLASKSVCLLQQTASSPFKATDSKIIPGNQPAHPACLETGSTAAAPALFHSLAVSHPLSPINTFTPQPAPSIPNLLRDCGIGSSPQKASEGGGRGESGREHSVQREKEQPHSLCATTSCPCNVLQGIINYHPPALNAVHSPPSRPFPSPSLYFCLLFVNRTSSR